MTKKSENQKPIENHWELEVYQLACDAAMRIYHLSKQFLTRGYCQQSIRKINQLGDFLPPQLVKVRISFSPLLICSSAHFPN